MTGVGICRCCATLRKNDLMIPITHPDHGICEKLRKCCQLEVEMEDSLPKCVCKECVDMLEKVHAFYMKVHEAQEYLALIFVTKEGNDGKSKGKRENRGSEASSSEGESNPLVEIVVSSNDEDHFVEANDNEDDDEYAMIQKYLNRAEIRVEKASGSMNDEFNEIDDGKDETYSEDEIIKEGRKDQKVATEMQVNAWKDYTWHCDGCDFVANDLSSLWKHNKKMHDLEKIDDIRLVCKDCKKLCVRYNAFLNHTRLRHQSDLKLRCDACDEQCTDYNQLSEHRQHKCRSKKHYPHVMLCPKCGKSYPNANAVQTHVNDQHSDRNTGSFACQQCDKKFKRIGALQAHKRVHLDHKEFTCELCGRDFRFKINLDTHLQSHLSDKSYECSVCKKCFKSAVNLERHSSVHTDVKRFNCSFCEKIFRTKDAKQSHERTHTGDKPFKCNVCGKNYRFRSTFISHMNVHTGNRPYSCEACNHHFTNWSNYNKHMKRKHGVANGRKPPPADEDVELLEINDGEVTDENPQKEALTFEIYTI